MTQFKPGNQKKVLQKFIKSSDKLHFRAWCSSLVGQVLALHLPGSHMNNDLCPGSPASHKASYLEPGKAVEHTQNLQTLHSPGRPGRALGS